MWKKDEVIDRVKKLLVEKLGVEEDCFFGWQLKPYNTEMKSKRVLKFNNLKLKDYEVKLSIKPLK